MNKENDTLAEAAEAEIETLSKNIQALEERLRVLKNVVALLRGGAGVSDVARVHLIEVQPVVARGVELKVEAVGERPTRKQQVRETIRELLNERGVVSRQELLGHLIDRGLMGHEMKPLKRLGNLLNMFRDEFGSDGKGNYHLRPSDPSEPGQGLQ